LSSRIFWHSNHPAVATGYGTQSAQVLRRLKKRGYDLAIHANYGAPPGMSKWNGIPVYPAGFEQHSQDVIFAHWKHWEAGRGGTMITLYDVWVLKNPHLREVPIMAWTPIDHMQVTPEVGNWLSQENVTPIAMSKHGHEAMARAGIEAHYVPHALESHWKPTPAEVDGFPGRFVVTMVAANKGVLPSRKSFGENILAFSIFAKNHPEALLYMHTESKPMYGIDLIALLKACDIKPDQVMFADQYQQRMGIPDKVMAAIYTRSDVLLACSAGEGFGLPVLEAQACGTRVVVSDFSAQSELVFDGVAVQVQPQWNPAQLSWFCTPLVHSIVEGLEWAFEQGGGHSQAAVDGAKQYDADHIFKTHWEPILP